MAENNFPLITIGITCFNAQDTIKRTIKSAQNQDYPNIEIIIVDDFSTDESAAIIQKQQAQDDRIKLIQQPQNQGYPTGLNTLIRHANGKYIAFFDDDDDNTIDRLSKQYKRLSQYENEHPNRPVICYTNRDVYIDGILKNSAKVHAIGREPPEPNGTAVVDYILWHNENLVMCWGEFGSCTMMAATQTLQHFLFDTNFRRCAEWDFAVRVAQNGGHFIAVDQSLVLQHKTQTTDKAGTKPLQYGLMLRHKHKDYLKQKSLYRAAIFLTYSRFFYFRQKHWKSRLYFILAGICAPQTILWPFLKKRFKHTH